MKWMYYLMEFNIIIRYNKRMTNKLMHMLSRPLVKALLVASCIWPLVPTEYTKSYTSNKDFNKVFKQAKWCHKSEFEILDCLMYKVALICIPNDGDRLWWIIRYTLLVWLVNFELTRCYLIYGIVNCPKMLIMLQDMLEHVSCVDFQAF